MVIKGIQFVIAFLLVTLIFSVVIYYLSQAMNSIGFTNFYISAIITLMTLIFIGSVVAVLVVSRQKPKENDQDNSGV